MRTTLNMVYICDSGGEVGMTPIPDGSTDVPASAPEGWSSGPSISQPSFVTVTTPDNRTFYDFCPVCLALPVTTLMQKVIDRNDIQNFNPANEVS